MTRKMRKLSMYTVMALLCAATVFYLVFAAVSYERTTSRSVESLVLQNMQEHACSQARQLDLLLGGKVRHLQSAAEDLEPLSQDRLTAAAILESLADNLELSWLCCTDAAGNALARAGQAREAACEAGLQAAQAQGGGLLLIEGEMVAYAALPGAQGALVGGVDILALSESILSTSEAACMLAADGTVLAAAEGNELFDYVGVNLFESYDMASFADKIAQGQGTARRVFTVDGEECYASSAPLASCGDVHVFFVTARADAIGDYAFISEQVRILEIRIGLGILALLLLMGWFSWAKGRQLRAEKLRLEWSEERYTILAENSNEVFFEYDVATDRFRMSENFSALYGHGAGLTLAQFMELVHADDRDQLEHVFRILKGASISESRATAEMRVRVGGEQSAHYMWCRVYMSALFDERGRRSLIIGKLSDISQERLNTERLEMKARTDVLTGLLNRAGLEDAIRTRFDAAPHQPCAMALLDVDDFKEINDFYGHDVGDDVLRALAEFFRHHFRGTDIVGRLGGDEFIVLMEGIDTREKLDHALARLRHNLLQLHVGEVRVGCSVGATLFPEDGDNFEALYKGADIALYEAKRMGKGRYTIYDGQEDMAQTLQALELSAFPAYAIDPDSCELLFANAKMCARFPSLRPGEKCYRSLMEGAQTPCEGCDLQAELEKTAFRQERAACTLCGEWLRASLTRVRWQDGRSVLLFCCRPAKAAGDAEADGERADG